MGTAASRDHAKLPFGYIHTRKDHSCNNSSVSRRRLARLLRTNDIVSVTPFPIDNALFSPSIPSSVVEYNYNYNHISISLPPNGGHSSTLQSNYNIQTSSNHSNHHSYLYGHNNQADPTQVDIPGGTGTGTGSTQLGALGSHPESGTPIMGPPSSPDSDSLEAPSCVVATQSHTHEHIQEHSQAHAHAHGHAHSYSHGSKADLASNSSAGSLVWSSSNHTATTNIDLAHANHNSNNHTHSHHNHNHGSAQGSSYSSFVQGSSSSLSIPRHKQLGQSRVQTSDMDIISALGIADRPYESSSYSFFGGSSSSPPTARASFGHHQQPQPSLHLHKDLITSLPRTNDMAETGASHSHPHPHTSTSTNPFQQYHKGKALSYEIKGDEDQDQDQEEDPEVNTCGYGYGYDYDAQSILDEEVDLLSPIPFSELPSLTNIGLCSHGIVKLSSNIRYLGNATCVQICCNELSRIPVEIGYLRNLTLLDLSKNNLTSLPESIMYLTKLVDLKLSFNMLESIPDGIGYLTKLAALSLDSNRLESIPTQIGLIKGLVNLDLSDNPITVLPAEIGKLQYLRHIKLDNCPLVEGFSHSPLHSPPTLLELAARVLVRHSVSIPPLISPHLKGYLDSAGRCSYCDGPYFDFSVKRGKMIEKGEMIIPLEYTLCMPHWNTELERVKLLFCPRPITSPPPKSAPTLLAALPLPSFIPRLGMASKKKHAKSASTSGVPMTLSMEPSTSRGSTPRPRKNTLEGGRERPLSVLGNRLSMFLKSKGDRNSMMASSSSTSLSQPVPTITVDAPAGSSSRPVPERSATSGSLGLGGAFLSRRRKQKRPMSLGSAL
ncbi:hypothetical protein BGZ93_007606 [Podila epicladia]|nr:hypothetical protein BGZ92_007850 [Podila epicladia]KAG0093983.1 hypothetical protein BGZ93_007606 [Podila epicladia]